MMMMVVGGDDNDDYVCMYMMMVIEGVVVVVVMAIVIMVMIMKTIKASEMMIRYIMIAIICFSQQSIAAVKEVTSVIGFRDHLEVSSLSVRIIYSCYYSISKLPCHIINVTLPYHPC
jgi:hypothetical protein